MVTREAVEADMPRVCDLNDVVQRLHADQRPDLYRWPPEASGRLAVLEKARLAPAWRLWVADIGGRLVGYVATELQEKPETALRKPHREGHIHHISVAADRRRSGVGRALAGRAIEGLREQQADRITVGYWAFNEPSRALFASLGFQPSSIFAELV